MERNPVRAKIAKKAWEYPWSSAQSHTNKKKDKIIDYSFVSDEIRNWADYISEEDDKNDLELFRKHANTGRLLGDKKFIDFPEKMSGRVLHRKKPGAKKRKDN